MIHSKCTVSGLVSFVAFSDRSFRSELEIINILLFPKCTLTCDCGSNYLNQQ